MPNSVTFEADYVEPRSRLTTFFRGLLAIPHLIVLWLWGIAAWVVVVIAWFALLFTGRYPFGMYTFVATYLRYSTYVNGYYNLLCDPYPPFGGDDNDDYPVRLEIGPPLESYSRLKVFFRWLIAIPVLIIMWAMQIVAGVGSFIAWFAIVILGRQPRGLQDMIALGISYQQRAYPYLFLLTEEWPPFAGEPSPATVAPAAGAAALPGAPAVQQDRGTPSEPEAQDVAAFEPPAAEPQPDTAEDTPAEPEIGRAPLSEPDPTDEPPRDEPGEPATRE